MKDKQNLLTKLMLTPFAGAFTAIIVIVFMMLFAWMFSANYEYLVQPLAALHGWALPDIGFGQWVALAVLLGTIKLSIYPISHTASENDVNKAITRIGTIFTYCILPYLINWIFL